MYFWHKAWSSSGQWVWRRQPIAKANTISDMSGNNPAGEAKWSVNYRDSHLTSYSKIKILDDLIFGREIFLTLRSNAKCTAGSLQLMFNRTLDKRWPEPNQLHHAGSSQWHVCLCLLIHKTMNERVLQLCTMCSLLPFWKWEQSGCTMWSFECAGILHPLCPGVNNHTRQESL